MRERERAVEEKDEAEEQELVWRLVKEENQTAFNSEPGGTGSSTSETVAT